LEQPWVWETGRLLLAALLALALLVFVVRPLLRNLFGPKQPEELEEDPELEQLPGAEEPLQLPGPEGENPLLAGVPAPVSYEDALTAARQQVSQEPAVAANVVKDWLPEDEQETAGQEQAQRRRARRHLPDDARRGRGGFGTAPSRPARGAEARHRHDRAQERLARAGQRGAHRVCADRVRAHGAEIGRASCRERVEHSVGGAE